MTNAEIENIVRFKIEEFNFNPMPGPFISDLSITKELLDDQLENISFNQSLNSSLGSHPNCFLANVMSA